MIAGILRETGNENRVAILPGETAVLKKLGHGGDGGSGCRRKGICFR